MILMGWGEASKPDSELPDSDYESGASEATEESSVTNASGVGDDDHRESKKKKDTVKLWQASWHSV
eukprot:643669-Amphidinium_carterae.1